MNHQDTIAAVATPAGRGGVGIVRVSGPAVSKISHAMTDRALVPRQATFTDFLDASGEAIDQGLALYFKSPASFTGEDVLELQGHGGPIVMSLLLSRVMSLGARMARPGEFSERAFLNDKLDLSQAEAVADLIDSTTEAAARGAVRSLKGVFSDRVRALDLDIVKLRMFVEAAIDFPEEEIDFLSDDRLVDNLESALAQMRILTQQTNQGAILREGITLVLVGKPNAGKSSLMNQFAGEDISIVTEMPGTTRDVIREYISLGGVPLKLVDTAGLREAENEIEAEGVRRARAEMLAADGVLVVIDAAKDSDWVSQTTELLAGLESKPAVFVALNKIDIATEVPKEPVPSPYHATRVSAMTGAGISELKAALINQFAPNVTTESNFIARSRHVDALTRAEQHLMTGRQVLLEQSAGELFAEELRYCHEALTEITGEFTSDDLLGEIFSTFCIGK
ncbi:MAG: tRNA modification GTPase [Sulfitobacter sp.]|jgi:tRNA modification GTPase